MLASSKFSFVVRDCAALPNSSLAESSFRPDMTAKSGPEDSLQPTCVFMFFDCLSPSRSEHDDGHEQESVPPGWCYPREHLLMAR